jgi:hypothetical protein
MKTQTELVETFQHDTTDLIGRTLANHGKPLGKITEVQDYSGARYLTVEGHAIPFSYGANKVFELVVKEPELTRNGPVENLAPNQRRVGPIVLTRHAADRWTMVFLNGPSYHYARVDELMLYAVQCLGVNVDELGCAVAELVAEAPERPESPVEALLRGMEERGTMLCKAERNRLITAFEEGVKLGHKEGYATGAREAMVEGYTKGYETGRNDGVESYQDSVALDEQRASARGYGPACD